VRLSEQEVDDLIGMMRRTLLERTVTDVEVKFDGGASERENEDARLRETEPNGTMTITIKVNGGARVTKDAPGASA